MDQQLDHKKIMFVTPRMAHGGTERMVSLLSFAFEKKGYKIVTVMYGTVIEFPLAGKLISLHARFSNNYVTKILNIFRRSKRLHSVIHQEKPDIILSYMGNIPTILTRKPLIANIQTHYERMSLVDKLALHTIYRWNNVLSVIVPSFGFQRSLEARTGLKNILVIPNTVDLDAVHAAVGDLDMIVKKQTIVAVGRFVPVKQLDLLIRMFARSQSSKNAELVLVGDGPERTRLELLAKELGVEEHVVFVGYSDNPYRYMAEARCLVVSSSMETFANVIIESFACGTPVVSFDCDFGPREIIRNGVDGFLVPMYDEQKFIDTMDVMINDNDTYHKMRLAALERAKDFSVSKTVDNWELLFKKLGL